VLIPALLAPDLTRGIPAWTVDQSHREIGHARSVLTATDTRPCLCPELHVAYLNIWSCRSERECPHLHDAAERIIVASASSSGRYRRFIARTGADLRSVA
jgi:hypothetical protein